MIDFIWNDILLNPIMNGFICSKVRRFGKPRS